MAFIAFAKMGHAQETEEWTSEVNEMLDEWHEAASEGDFESYFEATTEDFHFLGTDPTENWSREEFMKFTRPYFEDGQGWAFDPIQRNVYFSGEQVAYFDEILNSDHMGLCRGSGVFVRSGDEWKLAHYVLSLAVPNKLVDRITKQKKEMEQRLMDEISDQ